MRYAPPTSRKNITSLSADHSFVDSESVVVHEPGHSFSIIYLSASGIPITTAMIYIKTKVRMN